jgi:hypothetical protein
MLTTDLSFPDDGVHEVGVAVELVLDDVVEDLQQEEDQVVVSRRREQKPATNVMINFFCQNLAIKLAFLLHKLCTTCLWKK